MGRRLRVAVIGAGRISEHHLEFLAGSPQAELAAVCDLSPALGAYAAKRFRAGRAFTDHAEMLGAVEPEVVHVLTPPHTHGALAEACFDAGAHVIVEKPATATNAELRKLLELARRRDRLLIEDHNCRFSRSVLAIERLVAAGRLGDVLEAEVRIVLGLHAPGGRYGDENLPHPSHRLPAGAMHEFLPHLAYLALRFVPEVERVVACWRKRTQSPLFRHDDLDALVVGPAVSARLRFALAQAPECFSLVVRGTKGWAETDLYHPVLRVVHAGRRGGPFAGVANQLASGFAFQRGAFAEVRDKLLQRTLYENLHTFLRLTYDALVAGSTPPVTFEDMDRSSRLIDDLLRPENQA